MAKIKTLVFYNHANCGDLHVSRELVRLFCERAEVSEFFYAHRQSPRILADLPVKQVALRSEFNQGHPFYWDKASGLLALNTWYALSPTFTEKRCTLNTLRDLFQMHAQMHGIMGELPPIEDLIPKGYRRIGGETVERLTPYIASDRRLVFVANGPALSGQTSGDLSVFCSVMERVVAAHSDCTFLFSDLNGMPSLPNTVHTRDVTGVPDSECDLPECSFISTYCNTIIGRGSGAYTFAYVHDNFFDANNTMICFTDDERTARWVYPIEIFRAKIIWSNRYSSAEMHDVIESALR